MGINISVYDISKPTQRQGYASPEWWDALRVAGDRDFVWTDGLEWDYLPESQQGRYDSLKRPRDLQQARQWVLEHIPQPNQPRLLQLLRAMEANTSLYMEVSY